MLPKKVIPFQRDPIADENSDDEKRSLVECNVPLESARGTPSLQLFEGREEAPFQSSDREVENDQERLLPHVQGTIEKGILKENAYSVQRKIEIMKTAHKFRKMAIEKFNAMKAIQQMQVAGVKCYKFHYSKRT